MRRKLRRNDGLRQYTHAHTHPERERERRERRERERERERKIGWEGERDWDIMSEGEGERVRGRERERGGGGRERGRAGQLVPCNTVGSENRVRQHIKQLTVVTFCGLTSTSFARNRFLELLSSMGRRCFLMLIICTECTGESTQCSFGDPNTLYNGQGRRAMRT
jgi:hypothetical protein